MTRQAMQAYRSDAVEIAVEAAGPHRMITMLFDGAIAAVSFARSRLRARDRGAACRAIARAIAIVDQGLKSSLDEEAGGEIARNLNDVYSYILTRLVLANLRHDGKILEDVQLLLEELRSGWVEIEPKERARMAAGR